MAAGIDLDPHHRSLTPATSLAFVGARRGYPSPCVVIDGRICFQLRRLGTERSEHGSTSSLSRRSGRPASHESDVRFRVPLGGSACPGLLKGPPGGEGARARRPRARCPAPDSRHCAKPKVENSERVSHLSRITKIRACQTHQTRTSALGGGAPGTVHWGSEEAPNRGGQMPPARRRGS
jgi:hypothetical protein